MEFTIVAHILKLKENVYKTKKERQYINIIILVCVCVLFVWAADGERLAHLARTLWKQGGTEDGHSVTRRLYPS